MHCDNITFYVLRITSHKINYGVMSLQADFKIIFEIMKIIILLHNSKIILWIFFCKGSSFRYVLFIKNLLQNNEKRKIYFKLILSDINLRLYYF